MNRRIQNLLHGLSIGHNQAKHHKTCLTNLEKAMREGCKMICDLLAEDNESLAEARFILNDTLYIVDPEKETVRTADMEGAVQLEDTEV